MKKARHQALQPWIRMKVRHHTLQPWSIAAHSRNLDSQLIGRLDILHRCQLMLLKLENMAALKKSPLESLVSWRTPLDLHFQSLGILLRSDDLSSGV
jgi:hypothetical protein